MPELGTKDPLALFDDWVRDMPRAELGGLMKEYFAENNHNGWDGFQPRHLTGIRRLIEDLMLYHRYDDRTEPNFATRLDNINRVP